MRVGRVSQQSGGVWGPPGSAAAGAQQAAFVVGPVLVVVVVVVVVVEVVSAAAAVVARLLVAAVQVLRERQCCRTVVAVATMVWAWQPVRRPGRRAVASSHGVAEAVVPAVVQVVRRRPEGRVSGPQWGLWEIELERYQGFALDRRAGTAMAFPHHRLSQSALPCECIGGLSGLPLLALGGECRRRESKPREVVVAEGPSSGQPVFGVVA